ncbi:ErfK protein [Jannaschia pagri]|uniref:ErfK protein n=1 Tax=Jannaschia pagri TaxID=2829797 RepID=A0ABQ4NM60_9RHOB|nr:MULTISPECIES: L,D-transpeptidase [unclassified Jannaschia]GIT91491.1 ErfK protein [Jannaschia sp. AI_61]GIT95325.1 ErfK protein [Jannaschia sp. AI_62]
MSNPVQRPTRRQLLRSGVALAATLASPAVAQTLPDTVQTRDPLSATTRRNTSSFRALTWQPYFPTLRNGAILVDIQSRVLHLWEESGGYRLYPSSVPQSEDLTRRGRTRVVQKVVGPTWRPTPNMRRRNPEWPAVVGPGPDNPLGTHALYLGWTYYRIHGTHDTRKIGRRSSSGCIGLYNEHIAEVFDLTKVGTQVLLI